MEPAIHFDNFVLANTLGHAAGVLVFGLFLFFYLRDPHGREHGGLLPVVAAGLALLWNLGSIVALGLQQDGAAREIVVALSFCALSGLPAVLLHSFLGGRARTVWLAGYAVSAVAMLLHASELFPPSGDRHSLAILTITVGFACLAPLGMLLGPGTRNWTGLLGAMSVVLLAISFVHFGPASDHRVWAGEVVAHHVGIPLALVVLLQNQRFLLLDMYLRVITNGLVAAGFVAAFLVTERRLLEGAERNGFRQAAGVMALSLLLLAFVPARRLAVAGLERFVFGRRSIKHAEAEIRQAGANAGSEEELLGKAAHVLAEFAGTGQSAVDGGGESKEWEVRIPVKLSRGDERTIVLGARAGGRRYLSSDLASLTSLAATAAEQAERLREKEMQRLVGEAEFRALQSQINPHFLFNALNAVYGTIPRTAGAAREAVQNLAGMLRYCLHPEKALVTLGREMEVVKAYLALETLRLGERLESEIEVAEGLESFRLPALSIEPLVENAVKHGVAARPGKGKVRVRAVREGRGVRVEVEDSGGGFVAEPNGSGVGLENVRRRLQLYFGDQCRLEIKSTAQGTKVGFRLEGE